MPAPGGGGDRGGGGVGGGGGPIMGGTSRVAQLGMPNQQTPPKRQPWDVVKPMPMPYPWPVPGGVFGIAPGYIPGPGAVSVPPSWGPGGPPSDGGGRFRRPPVPPPINRRRVRMEFDGIRNHLLK